MFFSTGNFLLTDFFFFLGESKRVLGKPVNVEENSSVNF